MKTVYKVLALSVMMAAFVFANAASSFAQDDPKTDLYQKFVGCYKETDMAKRDTCYALAKEYLDKYEKDAEGKVDEYGAFVRKRYDVYVKEKATGALYTRFNSSIKDAKMVNSEDAFSSGREIIAQNPDLIDVPIVLASIGFDNAIAKTPNDKYNADAVNYAQMAIQKIEAGKTSEKYGANAWVYKNDKYPDGKNNTLGWMNYTIGYIKYFRQGQKKEALPFLYKATQFNSGTKNIPGIYVAIGAWYVDEYNRIGKEREEKTKAAGDVDTDETKALLALQKGYAERALDAYARAYKIASANPSETKEYKDSLNKTLQGVYKARYGNMDNLTAYLASVMNKPMIDPTTEVKPILDATTTTTTTTTSIIPTTPVTTTATTTTATKTTTTKKTPVKKVVRKKRGAR